MIRPQRAREFARHFGGLLRRLRPVQRRVQMDALAAAGNRDWVVPNVAEDVAYEYRDRGTLGQTHSRTGIKIKDQTIRILRRPIRPKRHCGT